MIQEISAFAREKLPHGLLLLSQVYLISRKFLVCCHDFIPGLTLHMGEKREQNISTLTCSPLALSCVKYGKNTQASLKSWFPAQARHASGSGSFSFPNHSSLRVALGCMAYVIFSFNKKEFTLMLFCIMLENFMSLFQFIAKNTPQRTPNSELASLLKLIEINYMT